jgi:hypothetical protein
MSKRLYNEIYALAKEWKPEEIYETEPEYRDDLLDFLKDELTDSGSDSGHISIKKEDGRGLCDIGVNRQIGIELKLDLDKKSKANRLVGQIHEYKYDYPTGIIVLLIGDTEHNAYQTVADAIHELRSSNQEFRILQKNLNESDDQNDDRGSGNIFNANPFEDINHRYEEMNKRMTDDFQKMNDDFADRFSLR